MKTKRFSLYRFLGIGLLLFGFLRTIPIVQTQTTLTLYDAFNDFSIVSNPTPDGYWSYGYTITLGGPYIIYTTVGTPRDPRVVAWYYGDIGNINKNISGEDINFPEIASIIPGSDWINVHPGMHGEVNIIRWTAPTSGIYRIDSSFRSVRYGVQPTTTDVHVLLNSNPIFNSEINGYISDGTKDFFSALIVNTGDTIDFAVGYGSNGNYSYDGSAVRATITLVGYIQPFLDFPVSYTNFETDAIHKVTSWFDHDNPGMGNANGTLVKWNGTYIGNAPVGISNCQEPPGSFLSCYDSHDGTDIDYSNSSSEHVYSAAPGEVFDYINDCQNSQTGCTGFGNRVWIDHGNCYATLYGHLRSVDQSITNSPIPVQVGARQQIGIMGNTGLSVGSNGTHLHFGVYSDPNCDGNWSDQVPVDPYGWSYPGADPWQYNTNYPLWIHPLGPQGQANNAGGSVTSSSGISAVVPPGASTDLITLELLMEPPISEPSAQLRSSGRSFWLRALEWLSGGSSIPTVSLAPAVTTSFNSPITVTVPYTDTNILHFDESQLAIYLWSEAIDDWEQLPTTVDTTLNTATAQTLDIGHFDLQAPLLCPGDNTEPSDSYNSATNMFTNNTLVSNLFDIPEDKDWQRFEAKTNWQYTIQTNNLASGVDTVIELYDLDGLTELASDDDSGGGLASKLVWQAPNDGTYFIRLLPKPGSLYGCSASYEIVALGETLIYMPLIVG